MNLGVVMFLHPLGELAVERRQRTQVQLAGQELVANGAKKPFLSPVGLKGTTSGRNWSLLKISKSPTWGF
jgi:hypothetical protein